MKRERLKEILLANGFTTKLQGHDEQGEGIYDLHPYVYEAFDQVVSELREELGPKHHEFCLLEYPGDVFVTFTPDSDGAHTLGSHRSLAEARQALAEYGKKLG